MLLVCIRSYLKSVLRYKVLILDICHPDGVYFHEDPWLFFEAQRGPRANKVSETLLKAIATVNSRGTCSRYLRFFSETSPLCFSVFKTVCN